ncbi:hypothetical protein TWF481_006265 [Arthrobotrys musiformis]|uniref:Nucleoside phosphorylase domain-containing protein n=1 Tax=Arthrobotrys musiformis TaxID=47236 RepID=A0AAV9WG83_9PEZI
MSAPDPTAAAMPPEEEDPPAPAPATKKYDHSDYTIGWICALSTELAAAKVMLDSQHPRLPIPENDANTYTLGSIGGHNIVIACLPESGSNQAAIVAMRMVSTFRAIKVGLLVGVGRGVPPKVKLGDVVVSTPIGEYPGVVQWDKGTQESGAVFRRTGALSKPPTALLTAVANLRSNHDIHGIQLHSVLESVRERFPGLKKKYERPSSAVKCGRYKRRKIAPFEDVESAYTNPEFEPISPSENSQEVQKTGLAAWAIFRPLSSIFRFGAVKVQTHATAKSGLKRLAPTEVDEAEETDTKIHYGLIASGSKTIEDAKFRDDLNGALGGSVLCVETEAAGLMDDFPCIVIRGICDYSDRDQENNSSWKGYAAATAAAYAKDLLNCLQPLVVSGELSARDIILTNVHNNVANITSRLEKEDEVKILKWITPMEYAPNHNDIVQKRQPGTGQWFLTSEKYHDWLQNSQRILFCPGMPGAGKTFLSSIVIDHLFQLFGKTPTVGIAYIYFNYTLEKEQTVYAALASLLKQLSRCQYSLPASIRALYEKNHTASDPLKRPPIYEVIQALKSVVSLYSRVFIVVDALDECPMKNDNYCRDTFLSTIFDLRNDHEVNIFATSRHIKEIVDKFGKLEGEVMEVRADDADLRLYLDGRINQSNRTILKNQREDIKKKIVEAVRGMFLLARLHFESIATKTNTKQLKQALEGLSAGKEGKAYEIAYGAAMDRIDSQNVEYKILARRVLPWVVCAERPLNTPELQHLLAVELGCPERKLDQENITEVSDIISVCAGLLTIAGERGVVQLIHYTAQEYFSRQCWVQNTQEEMAVICITYLSFSAIDIMAIIEADGEETGEEGHSRPSKHLSRRYDLRRYARDYWGHHARKHPQPRTQPIILDFLRSSDPDKSRKYSRENWRGGFVHEYASMEGQPPGIHAAASFGLREYVSQLLAGGVDRDERDNGGRTPLTIAAIYGYGRVVEVLVGAGADLEAKDRGGRTALFYSVSAGNLEVVEILLDRGASYDIQDSKGVTMLMEAAERGHTAIVELLLRCGAKRDINLRDNKGTALIRAAYRGHTAIVEVLVREGADLEAADRYEQTALAIAAQSRHTAIVKLLLGKGANREARGHWGHTPLLVAAFRGHYGIVEILLNEGADVTAEDERNQTVMFYAGYGGSVEVVQRLLRERAHLNTRDRDMEAALLSAARPRRSDLVDFLLREGTNCEVTDNKGRTPLMIAAQGLYIWDPEERGGASTQSHVIDLLLRGGANLEARDNEGRTALSWAAASQWDFKRITELLLGAGAELNTKDDAGQTPFAWAIRSRQYENASILMDIGADWSVEDIEGHISISVLKEERNLGAARSFLEKAAQHANVANGGLKPIPANLIQYMAEIEAAILEEGKSTEPDTRSNDDS